MVVAPLLQTSDPSHLRNFLIPLLIRIPPLIRDLTSGAARATFLVGKKRAWPREEGGKGVARMRGPRRVWSVKGN